MAVQTFLRARVLGVKLLTIEGTVLLSPAASGGASLQAVVPGQVAETGSAVRTQELTRANGSEVRYGDPGRAIGARLASSARLLDENARRLLELGPRVPGP